MTRHKIIDLLLQNDIEFFVYARMTDDLKNLFNGGFKGYSNNTYEELQDAIADFDEARIKELEKAIAKERVDVPVLSEVSEENFPF